MIRRLSYLFVVFASLLVGCGKNPVPSADETDGAILFGVQQMGLSTKALSTAPDDANYLIADGNQIGVFGTWTSPESVSTDVFSKIPITCKEESAGVFKWEYSPLKYWRKNGFYDFSAIFPYTANCQYGTNGNKLVASYSMHAENYDLMVASATRDLSAVDDTSPVNLTFQHAMAAVRFVFCKGSEANNYYLDTFQLEYLHAVGILVYNGGTVTVNNWNPAQFRSPTVLEWSAEGDLSKRISIPDNYSDYPKDEWHYVIPQHLRYDDGSHPTVYFSVHVNDDTTPVYTTLPLPETYDNGQDVVWEPGKMYTYYILIQPSKAYITVQVTPWDSYYVAVDDVNFGDLN